MRVKPSLTQSMCSSASVLNTALVVPRATRAHAPPAAPRRALAADSLAGLRVLCVDNDQEILDGMRALLGRWEVHVITANTVDDALARMDWFVQGVVGTLPRR